MLLLVCSILTVLMVVVLLPLSLILHIMMRIHLAILHWFLLVDFSILLTVVRVKESKQPSGITMTSIFTKQDGKSVFAVELIAPAGPVTTSRCSF